MKKLAILIWLSLLLPSLASATQEQAFVDIHGNEIRMSDLRGKWVVVNYWATWCPPCLEEMPELEHFHHTHKDDLAVVIGINAEQDVATEELLHFAEQHLLSFSIIPMQDELPNFGPVPGLPTTFLINPEGEVAARQVGKVTAEMIERYIAQHP